VNDYVGSLLEDIIGIRRNLTPQGASLAPTTSPRSRPTFAGSVSISAANFDGLFFSHQAGDGCTNRAYTILDGANFLLHRLSPFFSRSRRDVCLFSSTNNANDKGIRQHRQRKMPRPRWWESAHFIVYVPGKTEDSSR